MILREIFYFDRETVEPVEDKGYDPSADDSIMDFNDTRRTRLSLEQINRARISSELHIEEKQKELEFIRQMYGIPAEGAEAGV